MIDVLFAWLWQGVLIAVVATIATRLIPAGAAACRHAIVGLSLFAVVAVPWILMMPAHHGLPGSGAPALAAAPPIALPAPPSWLVASVVAVWVIGAGVQVGRVLCGVFALRALIRRSAAFDPTLESQLTQWHRAQQGGRRVRLRISDEINGACAAGFVPPTLLVSSELVRMLEAAAVEAIVLHEWAHIERYDDWTSVLERLLIAAGSVHPAVWWLARRLRMEREIACDQRVVARLGRPAAYARSLVDAASVAYRIGGRAPEIAPGSSTTTSLLKIRVERLLAWRSQKASTIQSRTAAALALLGAAFAFVSQSPTLVAFAGSPGTRLGATVLWADNVVTSLGLEGISHDQRAVSPATAAVLERFESRASRAAGVEQTTAEAVSHVNAEPQKSPAAVLNAEWLISASIGEVPASVPPPIPRPEGDMTLVRRVAKVGTTAADIGGAAGEGASRAGTSVGRWFKARGLAVARNF